MPEDKGVPAFTKHDSKSPSQHVSEVLGEIVNKFADQITEELRQMRQVIARLEKTMHHPPCDMMRAHLKQHEEDAREDAKVASSLKKIADEERAIKRKFWYNIGQTVIASLILGALAYMVLGFKTEIANGAPQRTVGGK